ncbi:hypothetical protein [Clostridium akagii]|uniref:hypothetical protein n=1 Tax=Clostridium akagii TaxID=91623 RepID=UPI000478FAB4|nr:hypothetical protein [Clostridium akagii]
MILNIILGFIIPWIFGVLLYFKDKKTLLVIAPFMSVWAYIVNEALFDLDFNRFAPLINDDITTMTINLGLYPILGCYLIYYIQIKKTSPYIIIMIFTFMTTVAEYLGLMFGMVTYNNGWNIGWTFLSYIPPYITGYWYYHKLKKIGVFNK